MAVAIRHPPVDVFCSNPRYFVAVILIVCSPFLSNSMLTTEDLFVTFTFAGISSPSSKIVNSPLIRSLGIIISPTFASSRPVSILNCNALVSSLNV